MDASLSLTAPSQIPKVSEGCSHLQTWWPTVLLSGDSFHLMFALLFLSFIDLVFVDLESREEYREGVIP